MSFFLSSPSHYRGSYEPNFGSLFRLLNDFDNYRSEVGATSGSSTSLDRAHFTPKFDCRETQDAFELHGELPGVDKENVSIEFTNPQTIEIRGRVERTYTSGTPPTDLLEGGSPTRLIAGDDTAASSHKATVEDAGEEGEETAKPVQPETTPAKKDGSRYWVRERSVGSFSRQFTFPHRVDPDNVQASYRDGILTVFVPKAKKPEPRRILIQ